MSRPDPSRSTALLIGTATHSQQALEDLPAVRANVTELARLVTTGPVDLVAVERCTQLLDLPHPGEAGVTIAERCGEAEDLLLVYYAGHGLLDDNGELFLALSGTNPRPDWLKYTAIPFSWIRDAMRDSPARTRVLILDCCFAGRALNNMSTADVENGLADRSEIQGTFTLTATSDNVAAIAPVGAEHTAFTGELLRLLQHGPPARDGHPDGEDLTLSAAYRHLAVTLPSQGLPRPRQRNTDLAADLVLRPARPASAAVPAAEGQLSDEPPVATPAVNLPVLAEARPVMDTLRRPQRLFHPLHRDLLARHWRRLALSVGVVGLQIALLISWLGPGLDPTRPRGWLNGDLLFTIFEPAAAVIVTVLAATASRDVRAGFPRDARVKWGLAIILWGVVVVYMPITVVVFVAAVIFVESPRFFLVLLCGALWLMWRLGREMFDRGHVLKAWWQIPIVVGITGGLAVALQVVGRIRHQAWWKLPLENHAFGKVWLLTGILTIGALIGIQVHDVLTGHLALARRPLVVQLTKQGIGVRTRAHNRFIAWHHLDRIFVAGNILAIAFKRDYPEVEKPREFSYSAALGGFTVADIRHFPHTRAEILHALSHFAGGTLHGVTPPDPDDDRLPARADGSLARRFSERWSTH
ncbi:caspase domain-containing protein [Micromonospora sp. NPDC049275]|uniref:caspase family protein n=1 Tax=Micromonospora sp. NPDC049275 TaxID=3364268 RepID=UPI00372311C6